MSAAAAADDVFEDVAMHDEAVDMGSMLQSSTSGDNPENSCLNCANAEAEMLSAMENVDKAAKLQARLQSLLKNVHVLAKDQADASVQLEVGLKARGESRAKVESLQVQSRKVENEKMRLMQSNKKLAKDLPPENYYVEEEEGWKVALARNNECFDAQSEKYVVKEARLRRVYDMKKHSEEVLARQKTDKNGVYSKLHQQVKINRSMRKRVASVVPILADISRHCSDTLPDHLLERLKKLPMDQLLQISQTKEDHLDDDYDHVLEQLLEMDSGRYRFMTKPGGKGSRGGRGAYRARWAANAERMVVDESMHEELLDRKLHRNDSDVQPAAPAEPAAKSVMGKKMETVRELQERKKGEFKNVIAELKKDTGIPDHPITDEKTAASNSGRRARSQSVPRLAPTTAATVAPDADLFQLGVDRKVNRQSVRNGPFAPWGAQQKKSRDVETMQQQKADQLAPGTAKSAPLELSALGLDVSDSDED